MELEPGASLVLMGRPQLLLGGRKIDWPETAPAYLGLFLAAQEGWTARERVADCLWPDASTERAQHNLRVALNRLGALLAGWGLQAALQTERRRLRLCLPSDLTAFREHVSRRDWARACQLPGGAFLEGVGFVAYPALGEWLAIEREGLQRAWRSALVEAAGTGADVNEPLTRYVQAHPTDADAATLLAHRLAAEGRTLQAQDVVRAFRRASEDLLDAGVLEAEAQRIEQGLAMLAPPPLSGTAGAAALLGRAAELEALDAACREHRWVSVVGLGGTGKSSLALGWMALAPVDSKDRGRFRIEIHEHSTAAGVADAVLHALAADPTPSGGGADARLARLARLQGWVVLDGLDPASAEDDLLALLRGIAAHCPGLRVLATSRAPLGVAGEQVHRLRGLSTAPGPDGAPSDAAQVFLREAQRLRPHQRWAARVREAERIAALCEGMPLALKLAASWTRWVEPERLAEELLRSLRHSEGALDTTLHACLAAPWKRLSSQQQQALSALALLPGPFDMRAAVTLGAVAAPEIEGLVALCLVESTPSEPPRLQLHSLVRAFAAARGREMPAQRRAAAARLLTVVDEMLGPRVMDHGQAAFEAAQVARCIDVLLAAWPLALEIGALTEHPWLHDALLTWHEAHGDFRAGARHLEAAEAGCDDSLPAEAALLARLRVARATLLYRAGEHDRASALAQQAERLADATGQRRVARRALNVQGLSLWTRARLDEAQAAFERGLAAAVEDGESLGEAAFVNNLALVAKDRGDFATAEWGLRRGLELNRELGRWDGACSVLNNLGNLLRTQGRHDECEPLALECLRLTHEHGLVAQRPFALIGLALLNHAQARPRQASVYLDLLAACVPGSVEPQVACGAALLRAQLALDRRDGDDALRHIAAALRLALDSDDTGNRAEALALYGDWLSQHAGRHDEGLRLWQSLAGLPEMHASLAHELRRRLVAAAQDQDVPAGGERLDLTLAGELALVEARNRGV